MRETGCADGDIVHNYNVVGILHRLQILSLSGLGAAVLFYMLPK